MAITAADILKGPRLKIQRANRHIDELRKRTNPLDRELYEFAVFHEPDSVIHARATHYRLAYRPKESIPEAFAAIIGDAVGNCRAALDHLASAIVRELGSSQSKVYFPITKRENLAAHNSVPAVEQALPGITRLLLDEVRPAGGPNETFWDFYFINNDDKHNFFIPVVNVANITDVNARYIGGPSIFKDCGLGFPADKKMIVINSDRPIAIEKNFKVAVDVTFGEGTPFVNEPVIPTLTKISHVASQTLDRFERFIRETKNI